MSIIKVLAPGWNVGRDLRSIDNTKLREQAQQRRQEQARLQQPPEKQPTRALFGPPIPVSRPNDETYKKLSTVFGPYETADVSVFQSFSSSASSDISPTDASHNPKLGDATRGRHDSRRSNPRQGDSRLGDNRQSDARQNDSRQRENRHNDARNSHTNDPRAKNSTSGLHHHHHDASASVDTNAEHARQGVFEQFVKSSSAKGSSVSSVDGQNSDKPQKHAKTDATSGIGQPCPDRKMKNKTMAVDGVSRTEDPAAFSQTNCLTEARSDSAKFIPHSKSSSSPAHSALTSNSSALHSNGAPRDGVRSDVRNSVWNQRAAGSGRDYEKLSSNQTETGRRNGWRDIPGGKNGDLDKKLTLCIPPASEDHEKFDEFVLKLIKEVSIPSPLTGILTPKKADIQFPFPDSNPRFDDIIPKVHLSDEDDEDEENEVGAHHGGHESGGHLSDSALRESGKTIPNQSFNNLLQDDLNLSSDSDDEQQQVKDSELEEQGPSNTTSREALEQRSPPVEVRSRRLSESSVASSSDESCSSESGSDSSQSDAEDDRDTKKPDTAKNEEEAEDRQSKLTSWEISNFIPKSVEQVPFSLSSSPLLNVNRQTSHDDFDNDIDDPIKQMCMLSPNLSPLRIPTSDIDHPESDLSVDIVRLLSPSSPCKVIQLPALELPRIDVTAPKQKNCTFSPPFPVPVSGVEYCNGKPSVVVRIRRSYLRHKPKPAKVVSHDDAGGVNSRTASFANSSAPAVSSKSVTRTDHKSSTPLAGPDVADGSSEPVAKHNKSSNGSNASVQNTSSKRSQVVPQLLPAALKHTTAVPLTVNPASDDCREPRVEKSPRKLAVSRTDETYPCPTKVTKRKSEDASGHLDQKKLCEYNSVCTKEEPKPQSLVQNGDQQVLQKTQVTIQSSGQLKSPMTSGEDNSSRSLSSHASTHKRTDKTKLQNGCSKIEEKQKKAAQPKDVGKDIDSEPLNTTSNKCISVETAMVNGVRESPAHKNVSDSDLDLGSRKRSRQHEEQEEQPLDRRKEPPNGFKKVKCESERLDSSDVYLLQARRLKHEGDSGPDKFSKAMVYMESVLAFVCHCSALEVEHAESARIQKMYQDTLALCQYVIRVMESVVYPVKFHLLVISLRIQSVISLRLYNLKKTDVAKLKSVLDEHNKNHMSKPLQIPSPYQASHHPSANATAGSWNHANGTPSPRSPRPSPSPAGSIGSVGSASSNGDSAMVRPSSLVNGHVTSIVVPQRIHSVMMNFLNHMNYLHQCHDYWDQAEALLAIHPSVGDFFRSIDAEFGPIDLHSTTLAIVCYASEVVNYVRSESKHLSQLPRTD